ncbi:hypothetical protein SR39_06130 [Methylobacterium radiotolerans]|nr:hypothetical protein SR39_06130 [Methylobacterium radiotolerans]
MALRRPLVRIAGVTKELPVGDTLPCHAFFTGSANLPLLTLLVGSGTSVVTVTPAVQGDSLAVGEPISVTPGAPLPAGLNIAYACVTAKNQVTIGFTAGVAIAGASMAWNVVALR